MQKFNEESTIGKLFLKKWHPQPSKACMILLFLISGSAFIGIGIYITILNQWIVDFTIYQYDTQGSCNIYNNTCNFTVKFPKMNGPVYMFYQLDNFYQNHRLYLKSKLNDQLAAQQYSDSDVNKYCAPVIHNSDLFFYHQYSRNQSLNISQTANPCGLIAKSYFNDSYMILNNNGEIFINQTGITWPNMIAQKFRSGNPNQTWIDVENEHFIVWMRASSLNNFNKLWGIIENGFNETNYTIVVENNYNPNTFAGKKNLQFSTSNAIGGKNEFLSIAYIVVGVVLILVSIIFLFQRTGNNNQKSD